MAVNPFNIIKNTIFPLSCVGCQRDGRLLCDACRADFVCRNKQHCPYCDVVTVHGAACEEHRNIELDGVVALGWYARPTLQRLIRNWKYNYVREAEPAIELLVGKWFNEAQQLPTGDWTVVPVPLHPIRARHRGFDQALILSTMIGDELGLPVDRACLVRTKHVLKTQAAFIDRASRASRKLDHFKASEAVPGHVILVDDVYTTGRTMQACAAELKRAGVEVVWGCVLARRD